MPRWRSGAQAVNRSQVLLRKEEEKEEEIRLDAYNDGFICIVLMFILPSPTACTFVIILCCR